MPERKLLPLLATFTGVVSVVSWPLASPSTPSPNGSSERKHQDHQDPRVGLQCLRRGWRECQSCGCSGRLAAKFVKFTDFAEIAAYGVMSAPGLMVDEKLLSAGRVLTANTRCIGALMDSTLWK